jgi:hypothetical protein
LKSQIRFTVVLAMTILLAACAEIPHSEGPASQAEALAQQMDRAKKSKTIAQQAKSESWQAVLPLIVAIRYQQASSASSAADERIALIEKQSAQRSCVQ